MGDVAVGTGTQRIVLFDISISANELFRCPLRWRRIFFRMVRLLHLADCAAIALVRRTGDLGPNGSRVPQHTIEPFTQRAELALR